MQRSISQRVATLTLLLSSMLVLNTVATAAEIPTRAQAKQVNENSISIVFHYEDIYRRIVADMTEEFLTESDFRVVPVIGLNHIQTIYDMLYMERIDLGIVHSDVLEYMARYKDYGQVYQRINSLVKLFGEKIAIIAGDQYESLEDLEGLKVNFGQPGKGTEVTGRILFDTVGVDVVPTRFDKFEALEKVKSGEIAAMVYLIEESIEDSIEEFATLSPDDNVTLISLPQSPDLLKHYSPAEFAGSDFPQLVSKDQPVPTLEVAVIIAAYNWPNSENYRFGKAKRFTEAFIKGQFSLSGGVNGQIWKEVSLTNEVPGITQLPMVSAILEKQRLEQQRIKDEAAAKKLAKIEETKQKLTAQILGRLDDIIASGDSDPEALEALNDKLKVLIEDSN